jgi:hypothetical protein
MGTGGRRGARWSAAALVVVAPTFGACSVGGAERAAEAWPPVSAVECLRNRPPVGNPIIWPAAVAVRDWTQPVPDGRMAVVLCAQGLGRQAEPLFVTVRGTGAVSAPSEDSVVWDAARDLVLPVTARVTGPGKLEIVISTSAPAESAAAAQGMAVFVVRGRDGLVLSECRNPASCSWD